MNAEKNYISTEYGAWKQTDANSLILTMEL